MSDEVKSEMDESAWSADQVDALMQIEDWATGGGAQSFSLGGLAGTGKSTVAGHVAAKLASQGVNVEFCAPTGRAASVLAAKSGLPARTVHSILKYGPGGQDHEDDCAGDSSCTCPASQTFQKMNITDGTKGARTVVVVDEASMVNSWMYKELMGLGAQILFVGDYGQLPPVGDNFSVVSEDRLDVNLRTLHRQAEGNPIIAAAWAVRQGAPWSELVTSEGEAGAIRVINGGIRASKIGYENGRLVLCATNRERARRNAEIRRRRWGSDYTDTPKVGDVIICLRNDPARGVFNGQRGVIETVAPFGSDVNLGLLTATMEDGNRYVGPVVRAQFGAEKNLANDHGGLFDFGYAMTVWKAQGSEADSVIVLGEKTPWMDQADQRKLRYTAVTRARRSLTVIAPG